jgi:hypothetical protein
VFTKVLVKALLAAGLLLALAGAYEAYVAAQGGAPRELYRPLSVIALALVLAGVAQGLRLLIVINQKV